MFLSQVKQRRLDPTAVYHIEGFLQPLILPMLENQFQQIYILSQQIYQANKK